MYPSSSPFSFLEEKVKILFIDYNLSEQKCLVEKLEKNSIFKIYTVSSLDEAERFLNSETIFHICISEVFDISFQKEYGLKTSFIYITNKKCVETGFNLFKYGAKGVYSKPLHDKKVHDVIELIKKCFLDNLLNPFKNNVVDTQVQYWCNLVREKQLKSISEWAVEAGVDESYLRRKIKQWFQISPKCLLNTYRLYYTALNYIGDVDFERNRMIDKFKKFYSNNVAELKKITINC